jgi:hypothetical protein
MPHRVPINVYKPTAQDIGTPKHIKNMSAGYSRANVIQTAGSAAVTFTSNNVWCLDLKNEMPQDSLAPNYFNKSLIQGLSASEASEEKIVGRACGMPYERRSHALDIADGLNTRSIRVGDNRCALEVTADQESARICPLW